jgi:putative transcriptional regulator
MSYLKREEMNQIKKYRKMSGISQTELAKRIKVARQTINLIENDKYNPSLDLCIKIAKELDTDLNALFWDVEDEE